MARILFITPQPFFVERGSPYRVRNEVSALLELGHEVTLLSYPLGEDPGVSGLSHIRPLRIPFVKEIRIGFSWTKLLLDAQQAVSSLRLATLNKYDIFHGVEEAGFMASWLGGLWRKPFIYDMHSHMSEQLSQCILRRGGKLHRMVERMENSSIGKSSGVITVSDVISERVKRISGSASVVTLEDLPLTIDPKLAESEAERLRLKLGLMNKQVLVYTGNFEPYQGVELMLEGFALLVTENPGAANNLRLLMVGGGSLDGERMRFIQTKAQQLGVGAQTILTGDRPESEMGGYMALADGLLSPRIAGAHTPLKVYTYMAAERPIVATRIAAHEGVLSDSTAYMAEPDPKGFASALSRLMVEGGMPSSEQRVKSAKAIVNTRFSRSGFVQKLDSLYNQALSTV